MKKFLFLFLFSLNAISQDLSSLSENEMQTFNSLPDSIKERIYERINQENSSERIKSNTLDSPKDSTIALNTSTRVFGYDFFSGIATSYSPINDIPVPNDYILGPRDKLQINLKGEKNTSYILEVDNSGAIFVPEIGEIAIAGMSFQNTKEVIKTLFKDFYVNIEASVAIAELKFLNVYLLGLANEPGAYLVNPFTTVSNLLAQAGGIKEIGSLRKVKHVRNGIVTYIDLYEMLVYGDRTNDVVLRNGDTVFIEPIKNTVYVHGAVKRPAKYEFLDNEDPQKLIYFAQNFTKYADVDSIEVSYISDEKIKIANLENFDKKYIQKIIELRVPDLFKVIEVEIMGEINQPGVYKLLAGTTLDELYNKADGFKNTASSESIVLRRISIYQKEKIALEIARSDLINAFVDNIANASTTNNLPIGELLNTLSISTQVEPTGRLVGNLSPTSNNAKQLILNDGDKIFIPTKPQVIFITGEVNNPSTTFYGDKLNFKEYINLAGGFTRNADKKNVYVIRSDGTSVTVNTSLFSSNIYVVESGDTIIVPKEVLKLSGIPLVQTATQIISNIAFSAASLNAIQD